MLTYVSRFILGGMEPFWPHVFLLSLSVVASLAVGAGIIFERPKYPPSVHRVAFWLVVGGVIIEAICTIFLFVFDEGISNAQQSKIEILAKYSDSLRAANDALARKITPRDLGPEFTDALKGQPSSPYEILYVRDADDDWMFSERVFMRLLTNGWTHPLTGPQAISAEDMGSGAVLSEPAAVAVCGNPIDITLVVPGKPKDAQPNSSDVGEIAKSDTPLGALARAFMASQKAGRLEGQVAFGRCADVDPRILKQRPVPDNAIRIVVAPRAHLN